MSFKGTAQEHREAAELCFERALYKAAASRYYYSLFTCAKGILVNNYSYYTEFLNEYPGLSKQERKRRNFPHNTMYNALSYCLQCIGKMDVSEVNDFRELWNEIYRLRIQADYEEDHISYNDIMECRKNFVILWERINNVIY